MNPAPSADTIATVSELSHNEIAQCARELWTESGQPEGRDAAIWLEAERRLISARRVPAATEILLQTQAPIANTHASDDQSERLATRQPPVDTDAPGAIGEPAYNSSRAASARVIPPTESQNGADDRASRSTFAQKQSQSSIEPEGSHRLTGMHRRTYQTIFQHPVSHNLAWHDVHALFRQLGRVEEEPNGNLKVTRNGQILMLPPPRTKDVAAIDELKKIRDFLERSEKPAPAATGPEARWLVVMNHHEVRIFRSEAPGTVPDHVRPRQADAALSHAHNFNGMLRGQEKPALPSFFEPVAQALKEAGQLLIFGSGTGTSNEMDQFIAWLKVHHPELARRIAGSLIVDEHHLTDAQLLAKARDFYTLSPVSPPATP